MKQISIILLEGEFPIDENEVAQFEATPNKE